MVEGISLAALLKLASNFGVSGIVFVLWYISSRQNEKTLKAYQDDMRQMREQYQADMTETRQMYKDNAELVRQYSNLAGDLKDIVIMNTQAWQQAHDGIEGNKYCPMVRLEKRARGRE